MSNENPEVCAKCGGRCCKHFPGIALPKDFDGEQSIIDALVSGMWAIDWLDFVDDAYFIRPATTDKIGVVFDPSWGGRCVFLHDNGCSLEYAKRPEGCKVVTPNAEGRCGENGVLTKQDAVVEWQRSEIDLNKCGEIAVSILEAQNADSGVQRDAR